MKNSKGYLLLGEETLKVVLAVLCIVFLAFLLYSLYNSNRNSRDLQFASESVDFLIKSIDEGETSVNIYNPKDWNIGTWPHGVAQNYVSGPFVQPAAPQAEYPKSCSNLGWTNCICICEENSADSCDDQGICVNNDKEFKIGNGNIQIKNPPVILKIDYSTKIISEE